MRQNRGVWELKIDSGPGYRIYYGKVGKAVVMLLAGGTKKGQQKDIELAINLLKEYKKRLCIRGNDYVTNKRF